MFKECSRAIAWNGDRWVAVGQGTNSICYSSDVINWYVSTNQNKIFSNCGNGVAGNPKIGATIVPSQLVLNENSGIYSTNKLDVVMDSYYNNGPTNITTLITAIENN